MQDMEKLHHLGGGEFCFKWDGKGDVRGYRPPAGFEAMADLTDRHPVTGEQQAVSEWWVFLKPEGGIMNVLELMDDVIHALNQLPNTWLSGRFKNTYALVAALEQAQRQNGIRLEIRGGVLQAPVRADFVQGIRVELFDHDDGGQSIVAVVDKEEIEHG